MKYIAALIAGIVVGAAVAVLFVVKSPYTPTTDSRLSDPTLTLTPTSSGSVQILNSATGYPWLRQQPASALKPEVAGARTSVQVFSAPTDVTGVPSYAVRFAALSNNGKPINGELAEESVWHVVVPGYGSLIIGGTDNLWAFAREAAMPLVRQQDWRGNAQIRTTGLQGTESADVLGVSGAFVEATGRAEYLQRVRSVSLTQGTAFEGQLRVEMRFPESQVPQVEDTLVSEE